MTPDIPAKEELLDRFDRAWHGDVPPCIEDFLPSTDRESWLLIEFIKVDLECRWRRAAEGKGSSDCRPLRLEDYAVRYARLVHSEIPAELIGEEYRARQLWGDRPGHAEYLARFPWHGPKLLGQLGAVDEELAGEVPPVPLAEAVPSSAATAAPAISVPLALESLREHTLLSPRQLDGLIQANAQGRYATPHDLAGELVAKNWLTPYQVNRLFAGRGHELLLGPYVILECLAAGGGGQVFKAQHRKMKRIAAVKVIRTDLLPDADAVRRFYREIEAISQFHHPHIVHAYDAGPVGATHFLAMEYLEGTDLAKLVMQSGPLPIEQAREYVRQACLGLQYIYQHGMVHRDIKPSNLFRTQAHGSQSVGLIKILDLGLVRIESHGGDRTRSSITGSNTLMMGTVDYMAPEQALDSHVVDIRADIYSLGCAFFYLLTGQPPFPGGTDAQKLLRHQMAAPPEVREFRPEVPADLAELLRAMLAKEPEQRPSTLAAVVEALIGDVSTLPVALVPMPVQAAKDEATRKLLVPPEAVESKDELPPKRRRLLWPALAAAALSAAAAGLSSLLLAPSNRPNATKAAPGSASVTKSTKPGPTLLFDDDFQNGTLAGWWKPMRNNPWQVIAAPGGKDRVLACGPLPASQQGANRFDYILQCGDASWTDYAVEVSAQFEGNRLGMEKLNGALVLARIQDGGQFYWLEYFISPTDGNGWPLGEAVFLLAKQSKTVNFQILGWVPAPRPQLGRRHRMRLEVEGDQLRGYLDGKFLVKGRDVELRTGGAGLVPGGIGPGILWSDFRAEKLVVSD